MSRKIDGPLHGASQSVRISRRNLLKGALAVLGAGVLIQPNGGVSGSAFADEKPIGNAQPDVKTGAKTGSGRNKLSGPEDEGPENIRPDSKHPQ